MTYAVAKNYTPEQGLSATFRQWRATSHCRFIHGYALGVRVGFSCADDDLDENGWVLNFGGLKRFKQYLADTFDHKTLVAKDDPALPLFRDMAQIKGRAGQLIQLVEVERTGCEGFARMICGWLQNELPSLVDEGRRVRIDYVEVYEHAGNAAIYYPERDHD